MTDLTTIGVPPTRSVRNLLTNLPPIDIPINENDGINTRSVAPFTNDEIEQLISLENEEGMPLLDSTDVNSLYQIIMTIIELKFSPSIVNKDRRELIINENDTDNELGESVPIADQTDQADQSNQSNQADRVGTNNQSNITNSGSYGEESLQSASPRSEIHSHSRFDLSINSPNDFNLILNWLRSRPWVLQDEVVHESPLLEDNRIKNNIAILELEQEPRVEEGKIKCRNRSCSSRRIQRRFVQTRSGDEGFTVFFTCVDCGLEFRSS